MVPANGVKPIDVSTHLPVSTGELVFKPMIAEHAGFSEMELQVPLIIIKQK